MAEPMNQHKQMAMGKMASKGAGQGKTPGYAKGGKVTMTKKATGGKVAKPSCNY